MIDPRRYLLLFKIMFIFLVACMAVQAQRQIPPAGIDVPDAVQQSLLDELELLNDQIGRLKQQASENATIHRFLPDVEIFAKAVDYAVRYQEFYKTNEFQIAQNLLNQGKKRAGQLMAGATPWIKQTGLVVRGYRSKLDDSVQPFGLVIPETYSGLSSDPWRLDIWLHGRDDRLTELKFIDQRQRSKGTFTPRYALVLHPYGRYCNAFKFAGEIDVLEALGQVKRDYHVDDDRLSIRGFSMGGAGCWHLATHHADLWASAAPGAGFAETFEYANLAKRAPRPWYEQTLWHWYDSTDYALNLFHVPTVAYSGELDKQIQAAHIMAESLQKYGIELQHIIGSETNHKYHPDAIDEINERIDSIMTRGRMKIPTKINFTTWTLRYPQMRWVTVEGLEEHWKRAQVEAEILNANHLKITTRNVTSLRLAFPSGYCPLDVQETARAIIDGQEVTLGKPQSDRSLNVVLRKFENRWQLGFPFKQTLQKKIGLQGPIDDAFMDRFLFVKPSGRSMNRETHEWILNEMQESVRQWRAQFRGDVLIKNDIDVTEEDIQTHHLILWGDPQSNRYLEKVISRLPMSWNESGIEFNNRSFAGNDFIPKLIYPNPLNAERYIVLNSGFTFASPPLSTNADQTPKLPDYAILNIKAQPDSAGSIRCEAAGFFDEQWKVKDQEGKN